ncbi:MAG: YlmC/YmxH family sporulation protein [Clostridia bacterium]|nr:YlmC/YmxH family sporulation protein [Clostridia bacterium]
MSCCIGDLRNKDVINVCNGKCLGCVIDVEIDVCTGRLLALIVPGDTKMFIFSSKGELRIPWDRITKIGSDAILVSIPDEASFIRETKPRKRE